jgi:hypothetical protein
MAFNARRHPQQKQQIVYQPHELRTLVKYAKHHYNIILIPEINLPGHAGSWAATMPELTVQCPSFLCTKGYGIPLNVSHPELPNILRQVLTQVVEIFDQPPFLHLGGDELHMSEPCLEEHMEKDGTFQAFNMTDWLIHDVQYFEQEILQAIVKDLGYKPNQIIRWETTGKRKKSKAGHTNSMQSLYRTGLITHYWETTPSASSNKPYIASTGLYLDVITSRGYGYGDFLSARDLVASEQHPLPFAIVAGTFELSTDLWTDRNVLGRLLAIRLGVSSSRLMTQGEFREEYVAKCNLVLRGNESNSKLNSEKMCEKAGWTMTDDRSYKLKWKGIWEEWKKGLCNGATLDRQELQIYPSEVDAKMQREANYYYWENLLVSESSEFQQSSFLPSLPQATTLLGKEFPQNFTLHGIPAGNNSVPFVGILLDLVQNPISMLNFAKLVETIEPLGLNLIQLGLTNDIGQAVEYRSLPKIAYSPYEQRESSYVYSYQQLEKMTLWAKQYGIQILPEINLATSGGGWFKAGMAANCPRTICQHRERIALDVVHKLEAILPLILAAIQELYAIFAPSSPFPTAPVLHLGSDEREDAKHGCFWEGGYSGAKLDAALNDFEEKLSSALTKIGLDQNSILRWNNKEGIYYPNRAGRITHFVNHDDYVRASTTVSTDYTPAYFGTVIMSQDMSIWEVFRATKRWIQKKSSAPLGLVAKRKDGSIPSYSHMVAFAMALSGVKLDAIAFHRKFDQICNQIDCKEKELVLSTVNSAALGSLNFDKVCLDKTVNVTLKGSKITKTP